jgi:hypothetical protein
MIARIKTPDIDDDYDIVLIPPTPFEDLPKVELIGSSALIRRTTMTVAEFRKRFPYTKI